METHRHHQQILSRELDAAGLDHVWLSWEPARRAQAIFADASIEHTNEVEKLKKILLELGFQIESTDEQMQTTWHLTAKKIDFHVDMHFHDESHLYRRMHGRAQVLSVDETKIRIATIEDHFFFAALTGEKEYLSEFHRINTETLDTHYLQRLLFDYWLLEYMNEKKEKQACRVQ